MISVTPLCIRLIFWPINNNGIADWTEDRRDVDHQDKSAVGFSNCHYGSCFQCFQRHSCWRGSRSCYSRSRHVRWVFTSLWPCHCFSYDEDWKAHSLQLTPLAPPTFTPSAISWSFSPLSVGISAANKLSKAGIENILILEATNRIGGRIQKTNFAGLSVEIGASWVEGVGGPRLNPIWDMVNRLKLTTFYSNYDNISSNAYKQKWVSLQFSVFFISLSYIFFFCCFYQVCIHSWCRGGLYEKSEAQNAFYAAQELSEFIKNVSKYLKAHRQDDISILASQRLKNQLSSFYFSVTNLENFPVEFSPSLFLTIETTWNMWHISWFYQEEVKTPSFAWHWILGISLHAIAISFPQFSDFPLKVCQKRKAFWFKVASGFCISAQLVSRAGVISSLSCPISPYNELVFLYILIIIGWYKPLAFLFNLDFSSNSHWHFIISSTS